LERLSVAQAPIVWRTLKVLETVTESAHAKTLLLDRSGWPGHLAGQHVDVRLTADDGYQAERSYSIASALRGPIGGHFTWRVQDGGPLLLIAGGSGLVPLMAMLRHRAALASSLDTRLLTSSRTWEDLLYRDELLGISAEAGVSAHFTLTRERPAGWSGFDRRVDAEMLEEIGPSAEERPKIFVCGPTAFVETAADALVALGHPPVGVHAERFGPT